MIINNLIHRPLILIRSTNGASQFTLRCFHYKFERTLTPPLQEPQESPYIIGPYLKPKYLPRKYITDPIKARDYNDYNHFIYKPTKIEADEERTVKLLLLDDVEGLGVKGQIVDAPYRFGCSKLVAMKKAEYATNFAKEWYKFGEKTTQSASTALSPRTARLLKSQIFKLPVSSNIIVQKWHLSLALRLSGCLCPIEAIEKESIVEKDGLVECIVRINNHERITVKFEHVKKDIDKEL